MRLFVLVFLSACMLSSCGVQSLYYWGGTSGGATGYENLAYRDYKLQTPEMICKLVCMYEDMVANPGGTRHMPPPGICAEYGYLLLMPATAEAFTEHATPAQRRFFAVTDYFAFFSERGREMLKREVEYYPESRHFVEPLIKKLSDL